MHRNENQFSDHHEYADGEYRKKEYEHQEYPKVIGKDEAGRDIVAESPEQEAELSGEQN